jgi:hypothetical protein
MVQATDSFHGNEFPALLTGRKFKTSLEGGNSLTVGHCADSSK